MKKIFLILFISLSMFILKQSYASMYTGNITQVWAEPSAGSYAGSYVMISVNGTPTGTTCTTSPTYDYAFSISGDIGQTLLSMVLSAYEGNRTVQLIGTTTCDIHSTVETLENIRLQ